MSRFGFHKFGAAVLLLALATAAAFQQAIGASGGLGARAIRGNPGQASAVFRDLNQAKWITEGDSARIMYVFFDPNCPYCRYLYDVSQQFVRSGQVEVRWIPIGLLTPTSEGKAAAILESRNEQVALKKNENGYHHPGGGGIEETLPSTADKVWLRKNMSLFRGVDIRVVPLIMWQNRDGSIGVQAGAVDKTTFEYLVGQILQSGHIGSTDPSS